MNPLEGIIGHYKNQLAGGLGFVDVPEWGSDDQPLRIWFKSATNPMTQEKLAKLVNESKPIEAAVEALIIRALNEDGTRMFKPGHRVQLMRESCVDTLIKVVGEINNYQHVDQDEVLGN